MILSDKKINKTVTIDCSLEKAWWAWTTHEGLRTFFGRDNYIELMPGGAFEIYFLLDNPQGLRGSEGCKIISILPKQLLVFSWNAPPMLKEARDSGHQTLVAIYFKSVSETQTEISLTHLGWPVGIIWDKVYGYFDEAWDMVLTELKERG